MIGANDQSKETIQLPDGRSLGYRIIGDPSGMPLFFFHGTPGSRLVLTREDPIANVAGLKLVLPERPGYGLSTPQKGRSIGGWIGDVAALADELLIDEFFVAGSSGGGPYALACGASDIVERVRGILLLNSAAPSDVENANEGMARANRLGFRLAKYAPWLLRLAIHMSASAIRRYPDRFIDGLNKQLCEADVQLLKNPEYREAVIRDLQEAVRYSSHGHYSDAVLEAMDWGIDTASIKTDVHLWHGIDDTLVPVDNVKQLASRIPNCSTAWIPDAGHLLIDHPQVVDGIKSVVVG